MRVFSQWNQIVYGRRVSFNQMMNDIKSGKNGREDAYTGWSLPIVRPAKGV